jgi:uncharacterized protein GlcG (DUF336 family)
MERVSSKKYDRRLVMGTITLKQASIIIDAALAKGRENGFLPLTVALLDSGGHLVAFKREDGSGLLRPQIAFGKAWGSLGMGVPSRTIRDNLADRPTFVNSLAAASAGRLIPVPGGVLVRDEHRAVIGAVGISGDTSEKDEYCAIEGISAAGLYPDPPAPDPGWAGSTLGPRK